MQDEVADDRQRSRAQAQPEEPTADEREEDDEREQIRGQGEEDAPDPAGERDQAIVRVEGQQHRPDHPGGEVQPDGTEERRTGTLRDRVVRERVQPPRECVARRIAETERDEIAEHGHNRHRGRGDEAREDRGSQARFVRDPCGGGPQGRRGRRRDSQENPPRCEWETGGRTWPHRQIITIQRAREPLMYAAVGAFRNPDYRACPVRPPRARDMPVHGDRAILVAQFVAVTNHAVIALTFSRLVMRSTL